MTPLVLVAALLFAAGAAALNAVTGLAGGVLLLSAFTVLAPAPAVVPLHGAVQLVASASRIVAFRRDIAWGVVALYGLALVPGSLVGTLLISAADPRWLRAVLAVYILAAALRRPPPEVEVAVRPGARPVLLLGLTTGVLGMLIGATGPLVSQVFLRLGLYREVHVATKSACQGLSHVVKTALFGAALGFAYADHLPLIVVCSVGVIGGTALGKRLLGKLDTARFLGLTRGLLGVIALKMLLVDVALPFLR